MIFDKAFGRVAVISLQNSQSEERGARALKELSDKKLSEKAQIVRAVDGRLCKPPAWWEAGPGAWGCMKSHVRIIEDALMDGLESVLIVEDDAIWQNDAARLAADFIQQVPTDWGQIYFGGQHRSDKRPQWLDGRPAVLKAHRIHRTHCYAIRRQVMVKMLQHIQHAPDYIEAAAKGVRMHVDHQLEVAHERGDWPIYCPSFWLAGQGENVSTINGRSEPARWWHVIRGEGYRYMPLVIADRLPTEEEERCLHFGNHISKEDCRVDEGIAGSEDASHCQRIMELITKEAIRLQRMPAIAEGRQADWMRKVWPGITLRLSDGPDLPAMCDFPNSKLLPHRWINPARTISTRSASDEPPHDGPKIHQVWIGNDEMPERLAGYCATIERSFPGWEYRLWQESDMAELAVNAILPEVVDGSAGVGMGIRVDVVRLEIIRQHGGVYLDCDFESLRADLRPLFERKDCFYYADERPAFPMNSLLGSHERGNAFAELYLQRIAGNLRKRISGTQEDPHAISGPHQLNATLGVWTDDEWKDLGPVRAGSENVAALFGERSLVAFYHFVACPYQYGKGNFATFDPALFPKAWLAHHWAETWHPK